MSQINPKVIVELPYVTGAPDPTARPDQRTIQYIRNGECIEGGKYDGDPSGALNRPSTEIQKNVSTLLANDKIINLSLKEVIDVVNSHDVALGDIGDDNLATKVQTLEAAIEPMPDKILKLEQADFLMNEDITAIETKLGTKSETDTTPRKIYEDITWIKREMGNYTGFDINGLPNADELVPTGMKYRIISLGQNVGNNTSRITRLENDWQQSDVGSLQNELNEIRLELGKKGENPIPNVYDWSKKAATEINTNIEAIAAIQTTIGVDSPDGDLNTRISKNKTDIADLSSSLSEEGAKIAHLTSVIGDDGTPTTLSYRLKATEDGVGTLNQVVGSDINHGLQSLVATVVADVGDDSTPNTIRYRLLHTETNVTEAQNDISEINNRLGNNTPGSETGFERRMKIVEEKTVHGFGGTHINANTEITNITTTDSTPINIGVGKSTTIDGTTLFEVSGSQLKYIGDASKVFEFTTTLTTNATHPVEYAVFKGDTKVFSVNQTDYAHFSYPIKLVKDDVLTVRVRAASDSITEVTIQNGAIYATQLN